MDGTCVQRTPDCLTELCPATEPRFFDNCIIEGQICTYGMECCCGTCHDLMRFECRNGIWFHMYLDNCLGGCDLSYCKCGESCTVFGAQGICQTDGSCSLTSVIPICPRSCACTREYEPVCGVDGRTYTNDCLLRMCHGIEIACSGECPCQLYECMCSTEYYPVCGVDSESYLNACASDCYGVEIACFGLCPCANETSYPALLP